MSKYDVFRNLVFWFLGLAALWRVPMCRRPSRGRDDERLMDKHDADAHLQHISIIIPARNEEHNLSNLLRSLRSQSTSAEEVIVVDDQSTDHTAIVARR